jgi:DNA-binding NtrC family response regulator
MRAEDFENLLFGFAREMRVKIKQDAVNELKKYTWPGNIRELRNMVSRASALIGDKEVEVDDICNLVDPTYTPGITANLSMKGNGSSIIKQLERQAIVEKLIEFQGNQRRTAEALGMPKSTLHDRIKYHAINIDAILDSTEV